MKKQMSKSLQRGFSMIELMLALVVIGVLAGSIFYIYNSLTASAKTENEISGINGMAANIRRAWKSSSDFSALSTSTMITRKAVPEKMINGTKLMNTWSGDVTVTPSGPDGGAGTNAWKITYNLVPVEACLDLVSGVQTAFSAIKVGGTAVKTTTTPFNQSQAVTSCSPADGNPVSVEMVGI